MQFAFLFRMRWWLLYGPIFLVSVCLLYLSATLWFPSVPRNLKIYTSQLEDGYAEMALRYRDRFIEQGLQVEIINSALPHDSLRVMKKSELSKDTVALAFVSGWQSAKETDLVANQSSSIQVLCAIAREPLWIFTRMPASTPLKDLLGMRVLIPQKDELSRRGLDLLFNEYEIDSKQVRLETPSLNQLYKDFLEGRSDVVVLLASAQNELVRQLLKTPNVNLIGVDPIQPILSKERRLRPMLLPQGVIEFRGNIPSHDIALLASDIQLLTFSNTHPAMQRLIIETANRMHQMPGFLQRQGEFPNLSQVDFPVSPQAEIALTGYKPFFEQWLPYGWAQRLQWLLFACLPILLLTWLAVNRIPAWFEWQVNATLQNFYGQLKFLETEIEPVASERPILMKRLLHQIDDIEMKVMQIELPQQYTHRWYTLRSHLADARERLLDLRSR